MSGECELSDSGLDVISEAVAEAGWEWMCGTKPRTNNHCIPEVINQARLSGPGTGIMSRDNVLTLDRIFTIVSSP